MEKCRISYYLCICTIHLLLLVLLVIYTLCKVSRMNYVLLWKEKENIDVLSFPTSCVVLVPDLTSILFSGIFLSFVKRHGSSFGFSLWCLTQGCSAKLCHILFQCLVMKRKGLQSSTTCTDQAKFCKHKTNSVNRFSGKLKLSINNFYQFP